MRSITLAVAVVDEQIEEVQSRLVRPTEAVRESAERVIDVGADQPPVRLGGQVDEGGEDQTAPGEDLLRGRVSAVRADERRTRPAFS